MIDQLFSGGTYQAVKQQLDLTAQRHDVLAGNIANVETPGYKRLDLDRTSMADFQTQLSRAADTGDFSKLASSTTHAAKVALDPTARSVRQDGNNVEVDQELLALTQNTGDYGVLTEFASNSLKQLKMAISGQVT